MSLRVLATQLRSRIGTEVVWRGWFNNLRPMGKINFLMGRDRTGLVQIVVEEKEELAKIAHLQPGTVLKVVAKVAAAPKRDIGAELICPSIEVEVPIEAIPPLEYYKPQIPCDLEFILDNRPMALRNRQLQAVFKVQAEIVHAYRQFMYSEVEAVEYFAPNLIGASSEGGSEFFRVDYFGYPATLAQSSQLYKQMMVGVNERVFALMPFFRAEPSHTPRHLSEGKQFEFEMGFFDHWHEILSIQEKCIKAILRHVEVVCATELQVLGSDFVRAPDEVPIPRLTFAEAQQLFYERTGIDERREPDLSPAAERELCRWAKESLGTELVFVIDWLASKRPFYAFPKEENPSLTNTFDLLCAGTEITSGGQRRHSYESMLEGLQAKGMESGNFSDYLSIFRHGMPPHGGFGMGLERLTMTLLRLKNIREASLFPSDTKRIASTKIKTNL